MPYIYQRPDWPKVSQDTAAHEIGALVDAGILVRRGRARATHYELAEL